MSDEEFDTLPDDLLADLGDDTLIGVQTPIYAESAEAYPSWLPTLDFDNDPIAVVLPSRCVI